MNRQVKNRLTAALLCVCYITISFFAAGLVIEHADHDCIGHDCSICAQIHSAGKSLKQLDIFAVCAAFAFVLIGSLHLYGFLIKNISLFTPVTLKIRMNH